MKLFKRMIRILERMSLAIVLAFAVFVVVMWLSWNTTPAPLAHISDELGADVRQGTIRESADTHGGFLGDGETVVRVLLVGSEAASFLEDIRDSEFWHPLPLSDDLSAAVYGRRTEAGSFGPLFPEGTVPPVENGVWFFRDRHPQSTDPADDSGLHDRSSWNFTAAIFDADTNILYYLELDT